MSTLSLIVSGKDERPLEPDVFDEMYEEDKLDYAFKAKKDDAVFETTILPWLKDTIDNPSNENELVVLMLHNRADRFIAEGIQLPPPFTYRPFSLFHFKSDFIEYLNKYAKHPGRVATQQEKKDIIWEIFRSFSYISDEEIDALITSNLIPVVKIANTDYSILFRFYELSETTIQKYLEYTFQRGDLGAIGIERLLAFFEEKVEEWRGKKQEQAVNRYIFAISYLKLLVEK